MRLYVIAGVLIMCSVSLAQPVDSLGVNAEAYSDSQAVLVTNWGEIVLDLFPDVAPMHVTSFAKLIDMGYYDSLTFHRIIKGTLIQGGCPEGTGAGQGPWTLPLEASDRKHQDGTLAMARRQDPNTASSQFYICMRPMPYLDGKYTVFGQVADSASLAVVHRIGDVKTNGKQPFPNRSDVPLEPVVIERAYIRARPEADE
jgi:peptidyl-prolyl cis-trans isomerase B (cyclophilin B)